ncbi:MAG TPA: MerR family transcriptional regulator [Mycobacteriales bacterium]|jgi:DNA-binding transcriptional MerR regulator|nr:MerR family transcriptional regulator [Mycobacteriales bacterium]
MGEMRIGQLAERAGVTTRTVRYYESLGLLPVPAREGSHRTYGEPDIARLRRIELLKRLGLSLDEVGEVISAYAEESPRAKRRVADVLRRHLAETESKLAELKAFRKELLFRIDLVEAYAERDERRR